MSRQTEWQQRMKAEGKCPCCAQPRGDGVYCPACSAKRAEKARAKGNFKAWRPGGPGRRPVNWQRPEATFP